MNRLLELPGLAKSTSRLRLNGSGKELFALQRLWPRILRSVTGPAWITPWRDGRDTMLSGPNWNGTGLSALNGADFD